MLCIDSRNRNPYYNLAAEEYYLKNSTEEVFIIWESYPSVVVGKHQNALAEINYRFVREQNIAIARRLTGGGSVFHDTGNINFSFIRNGQPGRLVDFNLFIEPVIAFLESLGIEATRGPKHEILVNGLKISGNAEHVFKNRVLHHGTLLFDTDLNRLRTSIDHKGGRYTDKAVQSNRASVMNLLQCFIERPLSVNQFHELLFNYVRKYMNGTSYIPLKDEETLITELAAEKYSSWHWIFGWSPDYTFSNEFTFNNSKASFELEVHHGMIRQCRIMSRERVLNKLSELLPGIRHKEEEIREVLKSAGIFELLHEEVIYTFF